MSNESEEFWSAHPCNARRGRLAAGDEVYFEQIRRNKAIAEPHLLPFMETSRWREKEVLDVGCGLGTQAVWFAENGAWVTACDFSHDSLALAERHAATQSDLVRDHILLKPLDFDRGIYPRHHYDLIWAWGTLHHMLTPARNLRALRAHCAGPNTVLKVMVYHRKSLKVWRLMARHGRDWRKWTEANGPVPISDAYTVKEARAAVELAGWRVDSVRVTHIFPWALKPYKQGRYEKAFPWNVMPEKWNKYLESRYGFHILIEARPAL
jgi:2-polyprenyl-3-methyl-5-hydroxy-6-metoxy-1,4-benzoquinol methylase